MGWQESESAEESFIKIMSMTSESDLNKQITADMKLCTAIAIYFLVNTVNVAIKTAFPTMPQGIWDLMRYGVIAILFVFLLRSIGIVFKRTGMRFVLFEGLFWLLYMISYVQGNANNAFLVSNAVQTLGICVPIALCVIAINDKAILYRTLLRYSYVILTVSLVAIVSLGRERTYSMSLASYVLVFVLLQYNEFCVNRKPINLAFAIYGIAFIFVFGNRAALLCIGFFSVLRLFGNNMLSVKNMIFTLLFIIAFVVGFMNFDRIVQTAYATLQSSGRSSYLVNSLVNGTFFQSASRTDMLFPYYWGLIQQKPLFGWGVYGGYISEGMGPHNIILEFLLAFGWIVGTAMIIWFLCSLIKTVLHSRTQSKKDMLLMIFCASCFYMFISGGEWLIQPKWFIYMSLCWAPILGRSTRC